MTPAARIAAAIAILDEILEGAPAERVLTTWARNNRFAGSGDRNAIRDHVYAALRCRNSFAAKGGSLTGRGLMIGACEDPAALFTGVGHAPAALSEAELEQLNQPAATPFNLPDWLIDAFRASLGENAEAAMRALDARAQVHLRVNTARTNRAAALALLAEDMIEAEAHPDVATGLIVLSNPKKVQTSRAYLEGLVELQDASSQIAIQTLPLAEKMKVLDYCAGGGGKSLAIAARTRAKVYAHDISEARMRDIPARAERAGSKIATLTSKTLNASGPYDLVFVDAPCSGSGTWRRTPDAKWRFTPSDLAQITALQAQILQEASAYVGVNGFLTYATCSVLREENEEQVNRFLTKNKNWETITLERLPIAEMHDGFFIVTFKKIK